MKKSRLEQSLDRWLEQGWNKERRRLLFATVQGSEFNDRALPDVWPRTPHDDSSVLTRVQSVF